MCPGGIVFPVLPILDTVSHHVAVMYSNSKYLTLPVIKLPSANIGLGVVVNLRTNQWFVAYLH